MPAGRRSPATFPRPERPTNIPGPGRVCKPGLGECHALDRTRRGRSISRSIHTGRASSTYHDTAHYRRQADLSFLIRLDCLERRLNQLTEGARSAVGAGRRMVARVLLWPDFATFTDRGQAYLRARSASSPISSLRIGNIPTITPSVFLMLANANWKAFSMEARSLQRRPAARILKPRHGRETLRTTSVMRAGSPCR